VVCQKEYEERKSSKVELIDFDRFRTGNSTRYVAVFQDGAYESVFVTDQPFDAIQTTSGLSILNLWVRC